MGRRAILIIFRIPDNNWNILLNAFNIIPMIQKYISSIVVHTTNY
eukprot:CAMPEP_0203648822 /NCGR_PEP_ID=MMETSP0088-20131115/19921_1 /ASSEMBLY_ACC=CAM_ASM_001087 /TAXON_ID=426623 /ORGANISM="Chaetoceros affinis, Strain CCMP159" /LENGTH=44 /DNA_ID= /DNA_START= /DNA_END= /DNA_ORIENTATION=